MVGGFSFSPSILPDIPQKATRNNEVNEMKKGLASRIIERGFFCANMETSRPELFYAFNGNCPRGENMPGRPTGLLYFGGKYGRFSKNNYSLDYHNHFVGNCGEI